MLDLQEIIIRLVVAALLGSAVGLERERINWVAGLRTHMLVCVGSTLAMIVSAYGFNDVLGHDHVVLDPSRVAAQVVSGIGFLGAGTIFFWRKEIIRGLTTAAALWAVASIGLAIGGGMYSAGIATTALVLVILAGIKPIEKHFFKNATLPKHLLTICLSAEKVSIEELEGTWSKEGIEILEINAGEHEKGTADKPILKIKVTATKEKLLAFADTMRTREEVHSVHYE